MAVEINPKIAGKYDPVSKSFTIIDATAYPAGATINSRTLRYDPPIIPGYTFPASATTAGASLVVPVTYENITIQASLELDVTYVDENNVTQNYVDTVATSFDILVTDCTLTTCLTTYLTSIIDDACKLGYWDRLSRSKQQKYLQALGYAVIADKKLACGDVEGYVEYEGKLQTLLGCSVTTVEEPVPVTPTVVQPVATAWTTIDDADLAAGITYPVSTQKLRYRVTASNELQIEGTVNIASAANTNVLLAALHDFVVTMPTTVYPGPAMISVNHRTAGGFWPSSPSGSQANITISLAAFLTDFPASIGTSITLHVKGKFALN